MKIFPLNECQADLVFRFLFSSIFLGLGMEHIFSDQMIMHLMPEWVVAPRFVSILSGVILLTGGLMICLGFKVRLGAMILSVFLVVVTFTVHLPGVMFTPSQIPQQDSWMWIILQRSNFVKNLCLLGVCLHLFYHKPTTYSLDTWLERRKK